MENTKFVLTLLCFEFIFHQGKSEMNITYYNENKSWKDAAQFCAMKGGVLEGSLVDIKNQSNYNDINDEVWIGKYKILTPWKAQWGCFQIDCYTYSFETRDTDVCQKLCVGMEFFSLKGTKCICISSEMLSQTKKPFLPCNCTDCFHVMKQNIRTDENNDKDNKDDTCMEAHCQDNQLKTSPAECSEHFYLKCDDEYEFEYKYMEGTHEKVCGNRSSFIKWYTSCSEGNDNLHAQHWTSATRTLKEFVLEIKDNITDINPTHCMKGKKTPYFLPGYKSCSKSLPFFCRFSDGERQHVSNETHCKKLVEHMMVDNTTNNAGAVIGSVVSVIVIAVVVATIFIYRRRLTTKTQKSSHSYGKDIYTTQNQQSDYPLDNVVINPNYSLPNPLKIDGKLSDDYATSVPGDYDKINENEKRKHKPGNTYDIPKNLRHANNIDMIDGSNESGRYERGFETKETEDTTDYSFATPINEDDNDPYTANNDYDRLHNVKKKENTGHKVYDHLPASNESDPTYDHTNLNSATTSDGDYDHFRAKS